MECYSSCLNLADIKTLCKLTVSCHIEGDNSESKFGHESLKKIIERAKRYFCFIFRKNTCGQLKRRLPRIEVFEWKFDHSRLNICFLL